MRTSSLAALLLVGLALVVGKVGAWLFGQGWMPGLTVLPAVAVVLFLAAMFLYVSAATGRALRKAA